MTRTTGVLADGDKFSQAQGAATVATVNSHKTLNAYYVLISALRKVIGTILPLDTPMEKTHRLIYAFVSMHICT